MVRIRTKRSKATAGSAEFPYSSSPPSSPEETTSYYAIFGTAYCPCDIKRFCCRRFQQLIIKSRNSTIMLLLLTWWSRLIHKIKFFVSCCTIRDASTNSVQTRFLGFQNTAYYRKHQCKIPVCKQLNESVKTNYDPDSYLPSSQLRLWAIHHSGRRCF